MFIQALLHIQIICRHLCGAFVLLGCLFISMTLMPCVQAQEAVSDPVTSVEATNATVWRDAVSTGSVTITCRDQSGNPVPNTDVSVSSVSPALIATSPGFSYSAGGTTDSNGTVTVTVKSVDFTLVGNDATVTLTATAQGVKGTGTVTLKGALQFLANNVDATNKTNQCNIGERQALTANMFSGAQVFDTWTASGATPIGGWDGMNSPTATTTTPFPRDTNSESTASLYLTTTGSDTTTLTAVTANATATASTSFTVSAPTDFTMAGSQTTPDCSSQDTLRLGGSTSGNVPGPPGISFGGSGGSGGSLLFGQILNSVTATATYKNGLTAKLPPVVTGDGLDKEFPYNGDTGTQATSDTPSSNNQGINVVDIHYTSFQATMYLLWMSNKSGSIPIPVESLTWSWHGEATFDPSTGKGQLVQANCSSSVYKTGTSYNKGVLTWTTTWNHP